MRKLEMKDHFRGGVGSLLLSPHLCSFLGLLPENQKISIIVNKGLDVCTNCFSGEEYEFVELKEIVDVCKM